MSLTSGPNIYKPGREYRLLLAVLFLTVTAAFFWLSSRYPALNSKALMGGDTPMSGFAFDTLYEILPGTAFWWEVVANSINWIYTNLKGMTFGIVFGAGVLTLLGLLRTRSFQSSFANSILGTAIGAPLGVCVNCALPIALGMHAGRMRLETTLSALFASPTLNVIVVVMSFSLLPFHLAIVKLGAALILVLGVVPLICRFILRAETQASGNGNTSSFAAISKMTQARGFSASIAKALSEQDNSFAHLGFLPALVWVVKSIGRNLVLLACFTIPLMFVSAVVSAMFGAIFNPYETLSILPASGVIMTLTAMLLVAVLTSMVPAPIALDVIMTVVLLNVGWADHYAVVALIALGSFSFYPFVMLWMAISFRTSLTLWISVAFLSVLAGVFVHETSPYFDKKSRLDARELLAKVDGYEFPKPPPSPEAMQMEELREKLEENWVNLKPVAVKAQSSNGSKITVVEMPLQTAVHHTDTTPFTTLSGKHIGLNEPGIISPIVQFGSYMKISALAAGDIHGDGWIDIATRRGGNANGLSLYANIGGTYARQDLDLGPVNDHPVNNIAFADIDGDHMLDMLVSTVTGGDYLFYNQDGTYTADHMITLGESGHAAISAFAFGDMDVDGDLDIILGMWASRGPGQSQGNIRPEATRTRILWNEGQRRFAAQTFDHELPGQTLTILIDDFDNDGFPDVLKGDDNRNTDQITFFGPNRQMDASISRQVFPYHMRSSMSYAVGDWNNDLVLDYYGAQIAFRSGSRGAVRAPDRNFFEICKSNSRGLDWGKSDIAQCATLLREIDEIRGGQVADASACMTLSNPDYQALCAAGLLVRRMTFSKQRSFEGSPELHGKCIQELSNIPEMQFLCGSLLEPGKGFGSQNDIDALHIPAIRGRNILMSGQAGGGFQDDASSEDIGFAGSTWTSWLFDLDQNGWQDILAVTGIWRVASNTTTNRFFKNSPEGFSDQTEAYGFTDFTPTYSYVTPDFDRDGDPDVIRDLTGLQMLVHRNDRPSGSGLWIHLRDKTQNSMGIGARVTVCVDGAIEIHPGVCQVRKITASGGFMVSNVIAAHFGLGDAKSVSLIEVQWPDGEVSNLQLSGFEKGELVVQRQ